MSVPKRKQLSKATRLEVLNKYDNHCAYCGCELTYEQLNVDHKIPLYYAEFGYDINYLESMDNYMPSCRSCNKYKTTYTIETFRKMIEKQPDILNRDSSTYRTKSGSYKANKIETDKCEIIYTNDTPHIDTIVQVPDEEQTKNWLTLSWMLSIRTSFSSDKYKIYVPEGTITDDFSIDME